MALDDGEEIEESRAVFLEELDVEPEIANISVRLYYTTELRNSFETKGDLDEGVMIALSCLVLVGPKSHVFIDRLLDREYEQLLRFHRRHRRAQSVLLRGAGGGGGGGDAGEAPPHDLALARIQGECGNMSSIDRVKKSVRN